MVLGAHRKIPRLKGQDGWFILSLLIMFSLLHHNVWMVKMLPGEGFYAKKCWHLRDRSEDWYVTCLVLALWLNEAKRIFKFLPALCFCIPLNDNGIWVNYYHHVGDPELVNMTERAETLAAPEAKSGALSASTPALEAASQKLCYALSQNYL